jgi:hypothetical protein
MCYHALGYSCSREQTRLKQSGRVSLSIHPLHQQINFNISLFILLFILLLLLLFIYIFEVFVDVRGLFCRCLFLHFPFYRYRGIVEPSAVTRKDFFKY